MDRFDALDVQVAEEALVPAGEREPRHRRGHADVDADHAGVEVLLELPRGVAVAGENAGAVAVFASFSDRKRFVKSFRADDGKNGTEDLLAGDAHVGLDLVDHAGTEEEP